MKTAKRFLALLLVLAMTMSNLPMAALADELTEPAAVETILEETTETSTVEATTAPVEEETQAPSEEAVTALAEEETEAPEVTEAPAEEVTEAPVEEPTEAPAAEATEAPAEEPTEAPVEEPTEAPVEEPTEAPAEEPDVEVEDAEGVGQGLPIVGYYTSSSPSPANAISAFYADPDEENVFYYGFNRFAGQDANCTYDPYEGSFYLTLEDGSSAADYATVEMVNECVYKITLNNDVVFAAMEASGTHLTLKGNYSHLCHWYDPNSSNETHEDRYTYASIGIHNGDENDTFTTLDNAYLTMNWLDRNEEGWYEKDDFSDVFRVVPGQGVHQIYYLNYEDGSGEMVRTPVHVQANGLNFEPIANEGLASGEENGEYFYRVTTDIWDQEIQVTCTVNGVTIGGVQAWTSRYPVSIYTDTAMSNDTVVSEVYMADVSDGAENELYVGMCEDTWTLESFQVGDWCSGWIELEDIGMPNMMRVRITEEGMRMLREGQFLYGAISGNVVNGEDSWLEWANFSIGPDQSNTAPYLTVGFLDDWGRGFREPEDRNHDGMGLQPGSALNVIFYLNYWDEDQGYMVQEPVKVKGSKYITVSNVDYQIEEGQQNAAYFCKVTASAWDKDTEVTYKLSDGTTVRFGIWTGRDSIGLYSSPNLDNDTWLGWEPLETDLFGENSAYIGLDRDGFWLREVTLPEEMAPFFDLERVNDNVFKITMNEAGLGRNLNQYYFGTQIFTEAENLEDSNWVDYQDRWVTFSREHLEGEAFFWVNDEAWELFVDGDDTAWGHTWDSGEQDEWGNHIWEGEVTEDLPVGLSYDVKENALTMDNFHGQYLGMAYAFYIEHEDKTYYDLPNANLTIVLRGENSLESDVDSALRLEGGMNVTFEGDGSLYVKSTNNVNNVNEEGYPYHYSAAYINDSDITFADEVNVTFEIAGEGLSAIWDEHDNYLGSEPAHLMAMHSDYTTITLKDDAVLNSVVPEGALMGSDESYGDMCHYAGFNNMSWKIQGGTLNTTTLGINSWHNEKGELVTNGYEQTGGTVNIEAMAYQGVNDEHEDEEGNAQSVAHTHYNGLTADTNCWITISGGELNINIDHDIEGGTPSVYYHGFELRDTLVNISGGQIRVDSNIAGLGMYLQNDWENEEWGSKLEMTGGTLEFNMPAYGQGINLEPGGEVNLLGGTIEGRNTAFNMGGTVLLDGATVNIWWGDFRADGKFTMESGKLYLDYRSELVFNGPSVINGGEIRMDNSRIMCSNLALNGGSITINNAFNNDDEGVSFEAFVINGYCTVGEDFELTINNDFKPVEYHPWPHSIVIANDGCLHQMGGSITINQHNYIDNPEEVVQAVYVEEGCKLLINDGTFTVSCDGGVEGIHSREGSLIFVGGMEEGHKPVLTVNDAAMMIGGTLDLEQDAKVTANQSRVVIWNTGFLQMAAEPANAKLNPVFTVNWRDVPENQQNEDYWSAAFQTHPESTVIINGGTLKVNAEYCDNAIMIDGTYIQNGGVVHATGVDPEWNATVGENCFCLGWTGSAEIHGGTMNLSGTDTGFSNASRLGNDGRNSVYITGGTMNINVDRLGMWMEDKTTITGGDFNITVNGHYSPIWDQEGNELGELLYEQGIMFYGWDVENECDEPNTVLNITGGNFDINIKTSSAGHPYYNVKSLFVVNASAYITDTSMRISGAPIVQVSDTPEHVLDISGVYSMNTGKLLVPMKYEAYYDEQYEDVDDPSQAVYTDYITIYEEDNVPDGNIATNEGIDYANNLAIVSNKAGGNLTWTAADGILSFEGTGSMYDFAAAAPAPWVVLSDFIHTAEMEGGVRYVGAYAFNGLKKLKTLSFLGDAPEINEKAFAGVKADGIYPVANETWTKDVRQNYGGKIIWAKGYEAAEVMELTMDLEEPVLRANQKATLTATVSETTDPDMKVIWSLGDGDKNYVTLKTKDNTATITAKAIKELREVTVYATTNTSRSEPQELKFTIIPRATKVEILRTEDDVVVSGTTQTIYMTSDPEDEETLELYARNESADADEGWKWTSSNSKFVTVEDGKVVALQPGKTVTITATATDGSGKKATVTVKTYQPVERIELAETETEVGLNKSMTLKATVFPANATNKKLKWEVVGDDGIATITSSGKLTGKKAGTAAVRVYADENTEMAEICYVTVRPAVTKVNIYDGDTLVTGNTIPLFMDPDPDGESILVLTAKNDPEGSAQTWTWKSSNTKYATVDPDGTVTALQAGKTVTITATAADGSGKKATVKIKTILPVETLELPAAAVAAKGKSITLVPQISPANATDKKLTWSLVGEYDEEYASIKNGKLTVKKNITEMHEITVRAEWALDPDVYAECKVTLYPTVVTKVTVEYPEDAVYQSGALSIPMDNPTIDLSAVTAVEDAADEITWKSSNTKYATVDENGKVTILVANKTVTITATAADGSGKKATIKVKGVYPITDLQLTTDEELFIAGGKSLKLANVLDILPENASNKKLTWSVTENEYKIKIGESTGVLSTKAVTEQVTVEVTAAAKDGFGAELTFEVVVYPATTKIILKDGEDTVSGMKKPLTKAVGDTFRLEAVNDTGDKPDLAAGKYTWKSSNSAYVSVDADGNVTVLKSGKTVTITCTAADGSGKTATVKIKA